ncbi:DNA-binding response regulator [Vibrio vulnificus]|uniref:response regulator transcription factor n=1 Tax=Vibrio vulnificus TaxID=672 RepID=UPI001028B8A8|nr:response regulator transcription factor [Vibrio vulnificus]RZP56048.1 DNA-binding response regulator [Vibrio vulnificus]
MLDCKILLIEDDLEIARLTKMYLDAEGYQVKVIHEGTHAAETVKSYEPHIVLLDLMLPGKDGATICKEIRHFYQGMIMVLTASEDEMSEVCLFKFGADDYVTKPVRGHVLVARIEALLRRLQRGIQSSSDGPSYIKQVYGLSINEKMQSAAYLDKPLNLTTSEFEILQILIASIDQVVTRDDCCQAARGIEYSFNNRSIDMRVSGLRRKLQQANVQSAVIKTIRNRGYMLVGTH